MVYGDTDSLFLNSKVTDLAEALKISDHFKKAVNDRYKLLEIDLDAIFQRLLLLQKKKYAAIKIQTDSHTSVEIKGLDMKRREYCALSKSASQYVCRHGRTTCSDGFFSDMSSSKSCPVKLQKMSLSLFTNTCQLLARMSVEAKSKWMNSLYSR